MTVNNSFFPEILAAPFIIFLGLGSSAGAETAALGNSCSDAIKLVRGEPELGLSDNGELELRFASGLSAADHREKAQAYMHSIIDQVFSNAVGDFRYRLVRYMWVEVLAVCEASTTTNGSDPEVEGVFSELVEKYGLDLTSPTAGLFEFPEYDLAKSTCNDFLQVTKEMSGTQRRNPANNFMVFVTDKFLDTYRRDTVKGVVAVEDVHSQVRRGCFSKKLEGPLGPALERFAEEAGLKRVK